MDLTKLKSEITNDPLKLGYAGLSHSEMKAKLQTPRQVIRSRAIDELVILSAFANPADGDTLLKKLETIGKTNTMIARVLAWLKPSGRGLDIGHSLVRATFQSMVNQGSGITQAEVTTVLNLALQPGTRAEELGLGNVTESDIADALRT